MAQTNDDSKTSTDPVGRGRPRGKRTNPDYRQLTIFVRGDTLDLVKIALIKEKGEVSELVEKLLSEWLRAKRLDSA